MKKREHEDGSKAEVDDIPISTGRQEPDCSRLDLWNRLRRDDLGESAPRTSRSRPRPRRAIHRHRDDRSKSTGPMTTRGGSS